jgi:hypothetical protein
VSDEKVFSTALGVFFLLVQNAWLNWLYSLLVILLIFISADLYRDLMLFLKIGKCLVVSVMVFNVFFL